MGNKDHREIEQRVFNVDKEEYEKKLQKAGAGLLRVVELKRAVLDVNPANPDKWIRVRTDGELTTLAVKERISTAADGTREHEIEVSDFDETLALLESLGGYKPRSIQESRRAAYDLGNGVEVSIDEWPIIGNILEIEAGSEAELTAAAESLGIDRQSLTGMGVEQYYLENHGIDVKTTPRLTFEQK